MPEIVLFTDGAASGNPGPAGWAALLITSGEKITELGGHVPHATNNQMELMATIRGIQAAKAFGREITLYTDSKYVIRGATEWLKGWKKNGWITSQGEPVLNRELWEQLSPLIESTEIDWQYVPGHSGIIGNERVDSIAVAFSKGAAPSLYRGNLSDYSWPIQWRAEDLGPLIANTPSTSTKKKSKKTYSYLSYVGSSLQRHKNWDDCKRRVEGVSGAKYAKAESPEDEIKIVEKWGLSKNLLYALDS